MSPTDCLGVSWLRLSGHVDRDRALARWAETEPVLAHIGSVHALARIVHDRDAPGRADAMLGALVRIATIDGGGDEDAAVLTAHLLGTGTGRLAVQLRDLSADIDELIAGALWIQIRTFPWRRRTRAYAKSLLLDTRTAVLAELRPYRSRAGSTRVVVQEPSLFAETSAPGMSSALGPQDGSGGADGRTDLLDLLGWAHASGAIDRSDAALLLDLVAAAHRTDAQADRVPRRGLNAAADISLVAARWGVNEKTIRRRRDRVLGVLRDARGDYLAAVA